MAVKPEVKQYLSALALQYGLDEKALLEKAEKDEKAAQFVVDTTMTRSDYSRSMDEVKRLQAEAETKKLEAENYYKDKWLPQWNQREAEYKAQLAEKATLQAKAAAYESLYGTLEGFNPAAPVVAPKVETVQNPQYMTREDAASLAGTLAKEMTFVGMRHLREFPAKDFDPDAFEKFVMERGYTGPKALRQAYEDYVKPDRDAKAQVAQEQALADAKKAGYEEAIAKVGPLPVDTSSPNFKGSPVFHKPTQEDVAAAALADPNVPSWQKAEIEKQAFMKDLGTVSPTNFFRSGG